MDMTGKAQNLKKRFHGPNWYLTPEDPSPNLFLVLKKVTERSDARGQLQRQLQPTLLVPKGIVGAVVAAVLRRLGTRLFPVCSPVSV